MTQTDEARDDTKVTFGSAEWLERARAILTHLVATFGTPGEAFGFCEVWTDAPPGSVGIDSAGRAAWHVRVDGVTCVVRPGEVDDVDLRIVMDYAAVLPFARRTTAESGGELPPLTSVHGRGAGLPTYFQQLHDALAAVTR